MIINLLSLFNSFVLLIYFYFLLNLFFNFFYFLQPLSDNNSVENEKSSTRSEYAGYSFQ